MSRFRARLPRWLSVIFFGMLLSCGDSSSHPDRDQPPDAVGEDLPPGLDADDAALLFRTVTITIQAVERCGAWEPEHQPGLNYQTPTRIRLGIQSVELMRSHKDPEPVLLPLPQPIVEVDASGGGELVLGEGVGLAAGSYSHIRVGLAYALYQIEATAHTFRVVPGILEMDMSLSNHEREPGQVRTQGRYTATFSAYGASQSYSGSTPLNCTLSAWGGIASTTGTRFSVRVPLPDGGVTVDPASNQDVAIRLEFPVEEIFSWRDRDDAGYTDGVYDISEQLARSELPDALMECNLLMADRCQGEAIVPLHPTWPMPDTGVSFCSDGTQIAAECPVAGEPGDGQDAHYDVHPMEYEIHPEVVVDQVTGLWWQRAVPNDELDWWEARDFCAALELADWSDWRLPSRVELVTLLDLDELDPTIDAGAFPDTPSDFFWSSSPVPFLNLAYGVRFELGFIYDHDPYGSGRVRCVRGAYTAPELRYTSDDLTVTDSLAGLQWQRQTESARVWLEALAACQDSDLGSFEDWRLPTLKELQTLVDDRRLQPSIDVVAFPDTPSEWYWSSTPIRYPPDEGWATSYTDGYASIHAFTEQHLFRCVRDL
ncbi:MAG: DUF1566 domain-containing protein [Bradymonadales bacterium]|nr:DUF1566 domain-containing protein [Bradymonadales bacterium]